jgi:hypothetical protein
VTSKGDNMADIKICDRCGKNVERLGWPIRARYYRCNLFLNKNYYDSREYDLCTDCTGELIKFFDVKKEGKGKKE